MTNPVQAADAARRRLRLKQSEVARDLGISQGHYSKVLHHQARLTRKLEERVIQWLDQKAQPVEPDATAARMRELAASIRAQCIELMHLTDAVSSGTGKH